MIIAVDAAGGDFAPHEVVKGAIKAAEEFKVSVALVGRKDILYVLAGRHLAKSGMTIVEATEVIGFDEAPVRAVTSKPQSSIVVGIRLVQEGMAAAFVSAGNTGAVFYSALVNLGKIAGIERPAIASFVNINASAPGLLIDAGANADCRPEHLVQFGRLGSTYARELLGVAVPRVALLNNGAEEGHGNKLVKESYDALKAAGMNFIGNIEGHEITRGKADVIVTDGFTGNIVLKVIEGMSHGWLHSVAEAGQVFSKAYRHPGKALNRDIGMDSLAKRLDFQEYGGACLVGVKGNVIIAHGRSQAKAIKNAIGLAKRTAERNIARLTEEESSGQTNRGE